MLDHEGFSRVSHVSPEGQDKAVISCHWVLHHTGVYQRKVSVSQDALASFHSGIGITLEDRTLQRLIRRCPVVRLEV